MDFLTNIKACFHEKFTSENKNEVMSGKYLDTSNDYE